MKDRNHIEIEARFINLDQKSVEGKLKELGATKQSESFLKEWVFSHEAWRAENKRLRVRDDGKAVWLTYKANETWEVDGTEEIEVSVSSAENAMKIIEKIGIPLERYQEKKRITYLLYNIRVELDFWPKIPMVLEIEGPTKEKVQETAELLGLKWETAIFVNQKVLHKQYYGIDLDTVKEYR